MIKNISAFKDFNSFMTKKYGNKIDFDIERHKKEDDCEEHVYLYRIFIEKNKRRKNIGSQFMRDLCCYADCEKIQIKLTPLPLDDEITQDRLENFYKKFGFQPNKKEGSMIRTPTTPKTKSVKSELL